MAYKGPGVYIKEVQLAQPVVIPGGVRVVGIAGKGSSTVTIKNVEVVRGSGNTDEIPGIDDADLFDIVGIGSLPDLYNYTYGDDYIFTSLDKTIDWSSGGSTPTLAATYYVTYKKVKGASYYEPITFYSIDDVRIYYGPELDNGTINEITLAARIAFGNGASTIIAVQQNGITSQAQQDAIDKFETEEIDVLLAPGMTSTTLQAYIKSHVDRMSSSTEKKERIFITSGLNLDDAVADINVRATAFDDELVTVIAPPVCTITLKDGSTNSEVATDVSGCYMGAALAGVMADPNYDEAEPLTQKQLAGFDSLADVKYKNSEMNSLASSGVTVLTDTSGIIRVRHALTTDVSNINNWELSVVSIKNQTKKDIRGALASYVGTKYVTGKTNALIAASIKSFCEQKVAEQVYVEYRNITVSQDASDGRIANIHFEFKPVYTLTWADITFALYVS